VFLDRPDVPNERPIIEVYVEGARIHVRRHVAMRGGGWIEEHVGSVPAMDGNLLARCVERALVGTSRLPITSIETPLPAYMLGMIAYCGWFVHDEPARDPAAGDAAADAPATLERRARALEILLRTLPPERVTEEARTYYAGVDLRPVLRAMFNLLVLSPYTRFVDNLMLLLRHMNREVAIDAIGYMLRHIARHLNAFDLVKFHNRGANYPDALMLDALLRAYVPIIDERPSTRRALLQGWLARKRCENLLVPDAPTSPGEAARLMPPHVAAVDPQQRSRRLFHDAPAEAMLTPHAREALRRAAAEDDLTELGMATFLDRPLGVTKRPGEPDCTPLLSYEAFSRRLAQRRMSELVELDFLQSVRPLCDVAGYPVAKLLGHAREGVVALEDAKKVAFDFVFTRTTRSSLDALLRQYDWSALNAAAPDVYRWLSVDRNVLLIRTGRATMTAFDAGLRPVLTLNYSDARYRECAGEEFVDGLEVVAENEPPIPIPPRCA
jgi:hypothetical protein